MTVNYVEREGADEEKKSEIVDYLDNNDPDKPWVVIDHISNEDGFGDYREALKELALNGDIRIAASGDIRLPFDHDS